MSDKELTKLIDRALDNAVINHGIPANEILTALRAANVLPVYHNRTPPDPVTQWLHKSGWEGNAVAEQAVRDYIGSKNDG